VAKSWELVNGEITRRLGAVGQGRMFQQNDPAFENVNDLRRQFAPTYSVICVNPIMLWMKFLSSLYQKSTTRESAAICARDRRMDNLGQWRSMYGLGGQYALL